MNIVNLTPEPVPTIVVQHDGEDSSANLPPATRATLSEYLTPPVVDTDESLPAKVDADAEMQDA